MHHMVFSKVRIESTMASDDLRKERIIWLEIDYSKFHELRENAKKSTEAPNALGTWNPNRSEDELKIQMWKSELDFERRELVKQQNKARKYAFRCLRKAHDLEKKELPKDHVTED